MFKQDVIIEMCAAYYADKEDNKNVSDKLVMNSLFNTQNGYVSKEIVLYTSKNYTITTESAKGKELIEYLRDLINFKRTYLVCVTLGRYPTYSACICYKAFCTHLKRYSAFNAMHDSLQIQNISNIEDIHIGFKPLKIPKDVNLAWTTVEQYLNGEIGVKPDDR